MNLFETKKSPVYNKSQLLLGNCGNLRACDGQRLVEGQCSRHHLTRSFKQPYITTCNTIITSTNIMSAVSYIHYLLKQYLYDTFGINIQ